VHVVSETAQAELKSGCVSPCRAPHSMSAPPRRRCSNASPTPMIPSAAPGPDLSQFLTASSASGFGVPREMSLSESFK